MRNLRFRVAAVWFLVLTCQLPAETPSSKAVEETSEKLGFRLSQIAQKTIGLATEPVTSSGDHMFRNESLVRFQDKVGVYRLRDGWFKLVEGTIILKKAGQKVFRCSEIGPGDGLVIQGTALLRVADMEAFAGGE